MGIDFGRHRIGVALSDPTRTLATPLATLKRRPGKRPPLKALAEMALEHDVTRLVVGLPLDLRGEESEWCREVRATATELGRRLQVELDFVDERFSSVQAERLVRGSGLPRGERESKDRVDQAAAALILQIWLDAQKRAERSSLGPAVPARDPDDGAERP
jgi:putative Holliday junction resolvase